MAQGQLNTRVVGTIGVLLIICGAGLLPLSCSADVLREGNQPFATFLAFLGGFSVWIGFTGVRHCRRGVEGTRTVILGR
jgi:hypothetical protein